MIDLPSRLAGLALLALVSLTACGSRESVKEHGGGAASQALHVRVDVKTQQMTLMRGAQVVKTYPVSTATLGTGNESGSYKTPLGMHRICEKVGDGQPLGMTFVGRKPTGKVATIYTDETDAKEDLITTRILWLDGTEPGKNRGGNRDSRSRYIYIHGTNEEGLIGRPASHGCVRMRNADVIDLYDRVAEGTAVEIVADASERPPK